MRSIKPCKEIKHGNIRYVVRIPEALQAQHNGMKKKTYESKADASDFCDTLNNRRAAWTQQIAALPNEVNGRLLRCLDLVGSIENLEGAVTLWLGKKHNARIEKTLAAAVEECVTERERDLSEVHMREMRRLLEAFSSANPNANVGEIEASHCRTYLNNPNWKARTRRHVHGLMRAFFNWAKLQKYVLENPMDGVLKPDQQALCIGILTVDQARELLRTVFKLDRGLVSYFAIGMFAGIRIAEMKRLTPAHLTQGNYIALRPEDTKTNRRRLVEVTPTLRAWLDVSRETGWEGIEHRLRKIARALSFEIPHNALRHSFISFAMALADWGPTRTCKTAGNSEAMIETHYKQLVTPEEALLFWALTPDEVLGAGWRAANIVPLTTVADSCAPVADVVASAL